MSIRLSVTKPVRIAVCSLFGLLTIGLAVAPATAGHHVPLRADGGTTQPTTPPPPPPTGGTTGPTGVHGWD